VDEGDAVGTTSWNYSFNSAANDVTDGEEHHIVVKAVDYAGNESSYFYHFSDIRANAESLSDVPTIEQIHSLDYTGQEFG